MHGQEDRDRAWKILEPADTLNKVRFWSSVGAVGVGYSAINVGLYHAWYKQYDQVGFHTFDDLGEWNQMDKTGHVFAAYLESDLSFGIARWTGVSRSAALWASVGVGTLLQGTLEVMDGFSAKWGFSWSDIGFNTLGVATFAVQELAWKEQRIRYKVSSLLQTPYSRMPIRASNSDATSSTRQRASELYGHTYLEGFLKDYNALTMWVSININAFRPNKSALPDWLNLAVGYGSENLYGGFSNQWTDENGAQFSLDTDQYPRYRQFYLSLDIDLSRIKTKSRLLRTLFRSINWIKIPAPAVEFNTQGKVRLHPIFW
ncbi:MAG: DUF2279 domain-containing protein [Saprospiraceae bacterium]|nr:MAG: DUF2279 domain-containing protein [Saprospiraceae bacterium]